jgi:hypothetical protein
LPSDAGLWWDDWFGGVAYVQGVGPRFPARRSGLILARMNDTVSLADVARVTVDDFRKGREAVIGVALGRELATAVELALLTAVRAERRGCAAECTRRAELWERTADRPGAPEPVRQEAGHRANEARYLADLLATRP